MSRSSLRRLVTVAASTAVLATVAPSPALAGDFFFGKSSGTMAQVEWVELGELPPAANAPGNAHFGWLQVEGGRTGRASAWGSVDDVQCEDGVTPYNPGKGGHGEPAPDPGGCTLLGTRWMQGDQLTFTVDRKLTKATLTGTLSVSSGDHGEGPTGSPGVRIGWTGVGGTYSQRISETITSPDGTVHTSRYTFTGRDAVVDPGSAIGPMKFDDEEGETSTSSFGNFRSAFRERA